MFRYNTTIVANLAVAVFLLVMAVGITPVGGNALAAGNEESAAGTWTVAMTTPAGPFVLVQTCVPLDSEHSRFSSVMRQVTENPTFFGRFPEADRGTDWCGHVVRVASQVYEGKFAGYLTRLVDQGDAAYPLAEIVAILILNCEWKLTDANAWTGRVDVAAYAAHQDADGDGLPDEGQEPVERSTFRCTAKRLTLSPPQPPSDATPLSVTVGEDFVISLEANHSTGYAWELASDLPTWLRFIRSEYKVPVTDPPMVGAGGVEEWTFRASAEGTATVTFEYRRPWEPDQPPAQRKTFVITARAAGELMEVTVGEDFVIAVDANPSTGYSWQLASLLSPCVSYIGTVYEPYQTDPPLIGGGGVETWRFRAECEGEAVITLAHYPPQPGAEPAETKTVTVIIHP
jgi:inhibitor of cysteine peptidase